MPTRVEITSYPPNAKNVEVAVYKGATGRTQVCGRIVVLNEGESEDFYIDEGTTLTVREVERA